MEISPANLQRFATWLEGRGRSEDTARVYCNHLRRSNDDPKGLTHRLVDNELSPNTRRTNLAALAAWAKYTKDHDLKDQLGDIRLPPARRVRTKLPLEVENWKKVVRHLQTCPIRPEAMRHVLLIMALRGFRSGDVLRMKRTEMVQAVASGRLAYEGKGRKRIEISVAPIREQVEALAAIRGWERVRDLVGKGSTRAMTNKVERHAKATAKQVGIASMNPHRFRHTFATNFLKELAGDPQALIKLQKHMVWESLATAARYADAVSQDELDTIGERLASGLVAE